MAQLADEQSGCIAALKAEFEGVKVELQEARKQLEKLPEGSPERLEQIALVRALVNDRTASRKPLDDAMAAAAAGGDAGAGGVGAGESLAGPSLGQVQTAISHLAADISYLRRVIMPEVVNLRRVIMPEVVKMRAKLDCPLGHGSSVSNSVASRKSDKDTRAFKSSLRVYYNYEDRVDGQTYCMLTHQWLPGDIVIAAHIFQRKWDRSRLDELELEIDSPGNGLLLLMSIEHAFDNGMLCFVPTDDWSGFKARIVDDTLRNCHLLQYIGQPKEIWEKHPGLKEQLQSMTFGELEGHVLLCPNRQPAKPAARVLYWQANNALIQRNKDISMLPQFGTPPHVVKMQQYFQSGQGVSPEEFEDPQYDVDESEGSGGPEVDL